MKTALGIIAAGVLLSTSVAAMAKDPKVTGLQLQQVQARDFEYPKNIVFSAVMSVLQDEGYRILSADKDTGLITGVASTESHMTWLPFVGFGRKKLTPQVSAYVEDRSAAISRLRLNFVMSKYKSNGYGSDAGEKPITDTGVYRDAFEKIEKAIFVRVAMDARPPAAAAAPTPAVTPAAVAAVPEQVPTAPTPAIAPPAPAAIAAPAPTTPAAAPKPSPRVTCVTC